MEHSFIKRFGLLIGLAVAGLIIVALIVDEVSPKASVNLRFSRAEIMDRARAYLVNLGYDLKDYQQDGWFGFVGETHIFLQGRHGMGGANTLIRQEMYPAHHWYVSWYDRSVPRSQNPEMFRVWISPAGNIMGFEHIISDTLRKPSFENNGALAMAEQFLKRQGFDLSRFHLKNSSEVKQVNRNDFRFSWAKGDTTAEEGVWVRVQGNEVGGYQRFFTPGGAFNRLFSQTATTWTLVGTASFAAMFLMFFFVVILFLKKYHEGEVGIRTAIMVFVGLFVVSLLGSINEYPGIGSSTMIGDLNQFNVRLVSFVMTVFILQVFLSVLVLAAWSVGESSSRSIWPEKLSAVDSALFRKFFTINIAEGILRGYLYGLAFLGGYALVLYLLIHQIGTRVVVLGLGGIVDSYVPGLEPLLGAIFIAVLAEIVYRLFFISYIKEKSKKTWLAVLVSTLLWVVAGSVFWDIPFGSLSIVEGIVVRAAFGLAFCWLFLRYDLMTAISANFVISAVNVAIPIFTSTGSYFHAAQWGAGIVLAVPLLVAVGGFVRKERFEFTPSTLPEHIQKISERGRMAKELEIARNVQMSLLPKVNPTIDGYEVAGVCIPALEVGGDYYDFVNLGEKKIGIAIGDVSGKGVPAAIYMTLTKGILQSHAEENVSPKKVLSKVNNLMYRTIERNSFVSMFYAVLDVPGRTIRFARAGQCPVILSQHAGRKGSFLSPQGIALGLEVGKVFDRVLEEQEVKLRTGEVLVFYTDGFTEAMNEQNDEFGEKRLVDAVARHRSKPAEKLILGICEDVNQFTGNHPQHDDMTMVVLKVL
jgi:sigma-B regulation protein RsbU (phosphoserine phosphatase)